LQGQKVQDRVGHGTRQVRARGRPGQGRVRQDRGHGMAGHGKARKDMEGSGQGSGVV
jgi:hypothetical protein